MGYKDQRREMRQLRLTGTYGNLYHKKLVLIKQVV